MPPPRRRGTTRTDRDEARRCGPLLEVVSWITRNELESCMRGSKDHSPLPVNAQVAGE